MSENALIWGWRSGGAATALAVLVALLTGCGGGTSSTASGAAGKQGVPLLTKADCMRLGKFLADDLGREVDPEPQPTPPFSICNLRTGDGLAVIYLDATEIARRKFVRRIRSLEKTPQSPLPVQGLGEAVEGLAGAYWSPYLEQLYAHRKGEFFTAFYPLPPRDQQRSAAIGLTRQTLELTAR